MKFYRFWSRWRVQFIFMMSRHQLEGNRYADWATIVCPFSLPTANTDFEIGIGKAMGKLDTFTHLIAVERKILYHFLYVGAISKQH